ncbi:THAP domain-containing protein 2-like [Melanaphis sacchari]|uniref:THAP domain-containing protein 2-like n=1 Tax=Melanaphis sacchari TaxID=742174 RepID=UPI000DC14236|nr:THAP domain-containing protein 2-like [Melanaphis sacchari]
MCKFCVICGRVDHNCRIIIHRFPTDLKRKQLWIEYVKKFGVNPKSLSLTARLCMRHFNADTDYTTNFNNKRLKINAVPSMNLTKVNEDILKIKKVNLIILSNIKPIESISKDNLANLGQEFIEKNNFEDDIQFMYSDSE